jgi:hypothetical protein
MTQQNETDAVIASGLSPSDRVVTTGFANLSEGLLVALGWTALALLAAALTRAVLALDVPAAAFLARREIGRRRLLVPADDDLCA